LIGCIEVVSVVCKDAVSKREENQSNGFEEATGIVLEEIGNGW
jgi:hypothetical protein